MADFKNEYKAAMNDITPDKALVRNIKENIKKVLETQSSKSNLFFNFKTVFTAASLLITAGAVSAAAIFITSPFRSESPSDSGSRPYFDGSESKSDIYTSDNDTSYNLTVNPDDFFEGYFSACVPISQLYEIAENIDMLTFEYFKQYAYVIQENSIFTITFYCHYDETSDVFRISSDDSTYLYSPISEDYMVRACFYVDDDDSKPFSVQISKNRDKDKGAFDGKNGIDLVTSADKLQDYLDGNYEEPFNNMLVQ